MKGIFYEHDGENIEIIDNNELYHMPQDLAKAGDNVLLIRIHESFGYNFSEFYNTDKLIYWDGTDNVYAAGNKQSSWLPKFGVGMYYNTKNWYAGLSVPVLFAYDPNYKFSLDVNKSSLDRRHYMATAGMVIPLNDYLKLKPSFLVKYVPNAPLQADLNLSLLIKDKFWVGGSFRSGDALAAILEYQTSSHFRVGYSYDFTFSNIRKSTNGSHEIMIGYDFGKTVTKTKSPRFF